MEPGQERIRYFPCLFNFVNWWNAIFECGSIIEFEISSSYKQLARKQERKWGWFLTNALSILEDTPVSTTFRKGVIIIDVACCRPLTKPSPILLMNNWFLCLKEQSVRLIISSALTLNPRCARPFINKLNEYTSSPILNLNWHVLFSSYRTRR